MWTKKLISHASQSFPTSWHRHTFPVFLNLQSGVYLYSTAPFSVYTLNSPIFKLVLSCPFWNALSHWKFMSIYYFEIQSDFTEFLFKEILSLSLSLSPKLSCVHICFSEWILFPVFLFFSSRILIILFLVIAHPRTFRGTLILPFSYAVLKKAVKLYLPTHLLIT